MVVEQAWRSLPDCYGPDGYVIWYEPVLYDFVISLPPLPPRPSLLSE